MLRLTNKSTILGVSSRLLASQSVAAPTQHERNMSSKKAVVVNMAGCVVPSMSPILAKYARQNQMKESDLLGKLFVEGDKKLLGDIEPSLLTKHSSEEGNLAQVVHALKSIRAEGMKVGLVDGGHSLKSDLIPLDRSLFDATSPALKPDICDRMGVDSSEVVYLDNIEANLKAAQALGMHAINVGEIEATLTELENEIKVPLKEFVPGWSWNYYDSANNPHKSAKDNLLYYFIYAFLLYKLMQFTVKDILNIDGTRQVEH